MLRLILLPFTMIRRIGWKAVWFLGWLVLWRTKYMAMLIAAALLVWYLTREPVADLPPEPVAPPKATKQVKALPPFPAHIEDGNSRFAASLLAKMNKQEKAFYSSHYHTAMLYTPAGEAYQWITPDSSMFGIITPGAAYRTKGGTLCRNFEETIKVRDAAQRLSGIGCERANKKGWCKLRKGSTPTCEIESQGGVSGLINDARRTFRRWF